MKGRRILIGMLALGLGWAQGPGPGEEARLEGTNVPAGVEDIVTHDIPVQGRLTDAAGNPVPDGDYTITFRLYDAEVDGNLLCEDTDHPPVTNGLFMELIGYCTANDINGQELWLEIQVEGDNPMLPRQQIGPVPYAWSLRPGAKIVGSQTGSILHVENTDGGGESYAVWGESSGDGFGVVGHSDSGPGVYGWSSGYAGYFDGDVGQSRADGGLVKAGVYAFCDDVGSQITRSFNNVNATAATIFDGPDQGECVIDFGFRINDRYFVATVQSWLARGASCSWGGDNEKLECGIWDTAGNGAAGSIMVLIY